MVFSPTKTNNGKDLNILIGDGKIDYVEECKFLGVMVDCQLTWKSHIKYTNNKLSKSIGILSKARMYFDKKTMILLYYSFIYPYLLYANLIWGNTNKTRMWPIVRIQKIAIRLMFNIRRRDSTSKYFRKELLFKFEDLYRYQTTIFMFKFNHCLLPPIFDDFFKRNTIVHEHRTRQTNHFHQPIYKTSIGNRFLTKTGVSLWNKIIKDGHMYPNLGALKQITQIEVMCKY